MQRCSLCTVLYNNKGYSLQPVNNVTLRSIKAKALNHLLSFPKDHFKKTSQRPLTPLMIQTLRNACEKQNRGVFFGPQDVKGSCITLINRGLIASHTVEKKGKSREVWYVTSLAISMLAEADIKILC